MSTQIIYGSAGNIAWVEVTDGPMWRRVANSASRFAGQLGRTLKRQAAAYAYTGLHAQRKPLSVAAVMLHALVVAPAQPFAGAPLETAVKRRVSQKKIKRWQRRARKQATAKRPAFEYEMDSEWRDMLELLLTPGVLSDVPLEDTTDPVAAQSALPAKQDPVPEVRVALPEYSFTDTDRGREIVIPQTGKANAVDPLLRRALRAGGATPDELAAVGAQRVRIALPPSPPTTFSGQAWGGVEQMMAHRAGSGPNRVAPDGQSSEGLGGLNFT